MTDERLPGLSGFGGRGLFVVVGAVAVLGRRHRGRFLIHRDLDLGSVVIKINCDQLCNTLSLQDSVPLQQVCRRGKGVARDAKHTVSFFFFRVSRCGCGKGCLGGKGTNDRDEYKS